jgi:hypothetical protein
MSLVYTFDMLSPGWLYFPLQNLCSPTLCVAFLCAFSRICIAGFLVDFRILAFFSIGLCNVQAFRSLSDLAGDFLHYF